MPTKLLNVVKAVVLIFLSILMVGCMNRVETTLQATQTTGSPFPLADHAEVRLSHPGDNSFYYYADGARIPLTLSLKWIVVKFASTDRAKQSAALQNSDIGPLEQIQQLPTLELTTEILMQEINTLRTDSSSFLQVYAVFPAEDAEMIITDEFITTLSSEKEQGGN